MTKSFVVDIAVIGHLSGMQLLWPAVATLAKVVISQKDKIIKVLAKVNKIITPLLQSATNLAVIHVMQLRRLG